MTEKTELQEWKSVWERVRRKRPGPDLASKTAFRIAMGLLKRIAQASGTSIGYTSDSGRRTVVEYVPAPTGWVPIGYVQVENIRELLDKAGCKHATEVRDHIVVQVIEELRASPDWAEYLQRLCNDFELDAAKLMMHADQKLARQDHPKLSVVPSPHATDKNDQ